MNHLSKYLGTLLIVIIFFIGGDIAVNGMWVGNLENSNTIFNKKIGLDQSTNKFLQVKIVPSNNIKASKYAFDGMHIQLLSDEYTVLQTATINNGYCQFNMNDVKKNLDKFILISPLTSDEMVVEKNISFTSFVLDASDLFIKQKSRK
ncbi:MAG: hypothetical protein ACOVSR_14830 [Bacteroidia bacterium]